MTETEIEQVTLEDLGLGVEVECVAVDEDCPNEVKWVFFNECCGDMTYACQEHKDWWEADINENTIAFFCYGCESFITRSQIQIYPY